MNKKFFINIFLLIMLTLNVFGVQVVENTANMPDDPNAEKPMLSPEQQNIIIWGLIIGVFGGLFIWLIYWIWKKLQENQRKDTDLLYSKYLIDVKNTHQNRDRRLKYRNMFLLGLTWKRAEIILNTENGLKYFGYYNGELIEANNFILINCHRPAGFLNLGSEQDIIIIPYELRTLVRKEIIRGRYELLIDAEAVDLALNTDYYNQIVVKNPKNKEQVLNFNEFIFEKYMIGYSMRQVLKDHTLNYRDNMEKSVDLNPHIQVSRKDPKQ
jgi:hypothetical protein